MASPNDLDHLLIDEGLAARAGEDGGDVAGGHVLGGVDPEPRDPETLEVGEIVGEGGLDPLGARVEIGQRDQVAVLHAVAVGVVAADVLAAGVEVAGAEIGILIVVERAAGAAGTPQWVVAEARPGHVVDHRVHIDAHPGLATTAHHVRKRGAIPTAADQLIADRLVALPPGPTGDQAMLVGGRDLDPVDARRPEHPLALEGHVCPGPLEEMDQHLGRLSRLRRADERREKRDGGEATAARQDRVRVHGDLSFVCHWCQSIDHPPGTAVLKGSPMRPPVPFRRHRERGQGATIRCDRRSIA